MLFCVIIYCVINSDDTVNLDGKYINHHNNKLVYTVCDMILSIPLLYLCARYITKEYAFERGQIPITYVPIAFLNVVFGFLNNQREYLTILAFNRIRRFYYASVQSEFLALKDKDTALFGFLLF
jgi:hypothetical protein